MSANPRSNPDYHEFSLEFTGRVIKDWKTRFFRKNSKYKAHISLRWNWPEGCPLEHSWRQVMLVVNGKVVEKQYITPEAYDVLKGEREEESPGAGLYYVILTKSQQPQ